MNPRHNQDSTGRPSWRDNKPLLAAAAITAVVSGFVSPFIYAVQTQNRFVLTVISIIVALLLIVDGIAIGAAISAGRGARAKSSSEPGDARSTGHR